MNKFISIDFLIHIIKIFAKVWKYFVHWPVGRAEDMKISIDASCLAINRFSGLGEFVHHLLLQMPFVTSDNNLNLFINIFRTHTFNSDICYPGTTNRFLRIPRRLVDLWWRHDWPEIDFYLKGINVFHSPHINVPPAKKIKTVAFTGAKGGKCGELADCCIKVPETETYRVQEYHLPVYHAICAMLEEYFYGK